MFVATDLEKYTSYMYEDAIKSNIQLNKSSNFATDFKGSRTITCKLQAREQTEGIATSSVECSGLSPTLFFSGNLQNYSEARQRLRLSNVFDQMSVAGLQLEI